MIYLIIDNEDLAQFPIETDSGKCLCPIIRADGKGYLLAKHEEVLEAHDVPFDVETHKQIPPEWEIID